MNKFTTLKKQSKRGQRAYYNAQRSGWGMVNPCGRSHKSAKDYSRSRAKQELRKEFL